MAQARMQLHCCLGRLDHFAFTRRQNLHQRLKILGDMISVFSRSLRLAGILLQVRIPFATQAQQFRLALSKTITRMRRV